MFRSWSLVVEGESVSKEPYTHPQVALSLLFMFLVHTDYNEIYVCLFPSIDSESIFLLLVLILRSKDPRFLTPSTSFF